MKTSPHTMSSISSNSHLELVIDNGELDTNTENFEQCRLIEKDRIYRISCNGGSKT